ALLGDDFVERIELRALERQKVELVGNLPDASMHLRVVAGDLRIARDGDLLRKPFDGADAVDERAARSRRLRGAEYRGTALIGQPLGVPRRIGKRSHERQRNEREAREQQTQKRLRIRQAESHVLIISWEFR